LVGVESVRIVGNVRLGVDEVGLAVRDKVEVCGGQARECSREEQIAVGCVSAVGADDVSGDSGSLGILHY